MYLYNETHLSNKGWQMKKKGQTDAKVIEKMEENYTRKLIPPNYHPKTCVYTNLSRITTG